MDAWRKNIKSLRRRAGLSQIALSAKSGVVQSLISGLESGTKPFTQKTLEDLAGALRCTVYDFFKDESDQPQQPSPKVAGAIAPADLRLLTQWVMEQEEPSRMAANIRFMVETRYADFEMWIKKREEEGQDSSAPGSVSVVGE